MESTLPHRDGERRHACRLDPSINALVVRAEMLEMGAIAGFSWIQDRNDQAWTADVRSNERRSLSKLAKTIEISHQRPVRIQRRWRRHCDALDGLQEC